MQTAIFDIGNVIIFFSLAKMIDQISQCTGLKSQEIKQLFAKKNLQFNYESGAISSRELYECFAQNSPKRFSQEAFFTAASDIFTPNYEIFPILNQLKQKGVRLLLLSNTSEAHFNHIRANYPILNLFDDKILSFEVKASKPDPKIYHAALEKSHCPPANCFYTDDIAEYIAAARTHGIDAEQFTGAASLTNHLQSRLLLKDPSN